MPAQAEYVYLAGFYFFVVSALSLLTEGAC
jgi:hypothetical protein